MLMIVLGLAALLFVGLSIVYFTTSANNLPSFMPGHQAGSTRHHTKHGIAMLGLAAASLVGAWMLSGDSANTP
jgi:amino acid permease